MRSVILLALGKSGASGIAVGILYALFMAIFLGHVSAVDPILLGLIVAVTMAFPFVILDMENYRNDG